jgi:2-hydroxychromene-2-carboxylate isomerase
MPLARQDIARFARRLKIPYNPPPPETDPTLAGAGSLYAEHAGLLRPYIQTVMHAEWGEGKNIGDPDVLLALAEQIGLDRQEFADAIHREENHRQLLRHAEIAKEHGVIGVPTFMVGEQIFWGQDRIDFVLEELDRLTEPGDD